MSDGVASRSRRTLVVGVLAAALALVGALLLPWRPTDGPTAEPGVLTNGVAAEARPALTAVDPMGGVTTNSPRSSDAPGARIAVEDGSGETPPGQVRIEVFGTGGMEVEGAAVDLYAVERGASGDSRLSWIARGLVSDAMGLVEHDLGDARPGALAFTVEAEGYAPQRLPLDRDGDAWTKLVRLTAGSTVTGRVLDTLGNPVARATLTFRGERRDTSVGLSLDPDGKFSVGVRDSGSFVGVVRSSGIGTSVEFPLELSGSGRTDLGTIQLSDLGSVAGRVSLADGTPLPSLTVSAIAYGMGEGTSRGEAATSADGRFHIRGLRDGEVALSIERASRAPVHGPKWVATPAEGLEYTVDGWLIDVEARDGDGGLDPIVSLEVGAQRAGSIRPDVLHDGGSSAFGYSILIPRERSVVTATGRSGARYFGALEADLEAGRHSLVLRSDAHGLGTVRVRAEGLGLGPEERLAVGLVPVEGGAFRRVSAPADDDVVSVDGVPAGVYECRVQVFGAEFACVDALLPPRVTVTAGRTVETEVTVLLGGRLVLELSVLGLDRREALRERLELVPKLRAVGAQEWTRSPTLLVLPARLAPGTPILPLGQRAELDVALPPGPYTLALDGLPSTYEPYEATVQILAGRRSQHAVEVTRCP